MKKVLIAAFAFLAVIAMSCQNTGNGGKEQASKEKENEAQIKQRVEQMMQMHELFDADKILTTELYDLQTKAQSVHFWANFFPGFQWDLAVQDACSENRSAVIEGVTPVDSLHCDVAMRYVDSTCYEAPYTLKLLKEKGEWRIDDVIFNETSLREDCVTFYEDVIETYKTEAPEDIMEFLMSEEPDEDYYASPDCTPDDLRSLIEDIKNFHGLFMQNPKYTEEYGKQIDAMIGRIESHIQ